MDTIYDVIILGAGPAGLSAAIYAGRGRLNTLLLEQGQDGGQIALTAHLDNYPGQLEGDSAPASSPGCPRRLTEPAFSGSGIPSARRSWTVP